MKPYETVSVEKQKILTSKNNGIIKIRYDY